MNILVISLAGIGDTLFATPLIHELRANFPDGSIEALVRWPGAKDLLEGNPHLNAVHQKDLIETGKIESLKYLWRLRRNRYDVSFNTHPQSRLHYRAVARCINAAVRVSHEYDGASVFDCLLVNRSLPQDYQRHSVENNLALLNFLDVKPLLRRHDYEIYLSAEELSWANQFLAANKLSSRVLLGIHPGSGSTKNLALRRWPLDAYIELIGRLNRSLPDLAVLVFGGPDEEKDRQRILAQSDQTRVFCPRTQCLRQAAALIQRCQLFLSVDTSLMHLAAATRVPKQIVIETPTWNKAIEPYSGSFVLIRNPAVAGRNLEYYRYDGRGIQGTEDELRRCMASVSVDAVYSALMGAISQ